MSRMIQNMDQNNGTSDNPSTSDQKRKKMKTNNNSTTVMSRNALYTPLIAYDNYAASEDPQKNDPSLYMASRKSANIPASIRESSLTEFLHTVGVEFHSNYFSITGGTNNGNKPLSRQDVDDRIRQRALTLVGSGIAHASIASTSNRRKTPQNETVRQSTKQQQLSYKKRKQCLLEKHPQRTKISKIQETILLDLHSLWNEYIKRLLSWGGGTDSSCVWGSKDIATVMAKVEWVGAHVQILECSSRPHFVRRNAYVVDTTQNTWKLAMGIITPRHKKKRKRKKKKHPPSTDIAKVGHVGHESRIIRAATPKNPKNDETQEKSPLTTKTSKDQVDNSYIVYTVPRQGSILAVRIPCSSGSEEEESNNYMVKIK